MLFRWFGFSIFKDPTVREAIAPLSIPSSAPIRLAQHSSQHPPPPEEDEDRKWIVLGVITIWIVYK